MERDATDTAPPLQHGHFNSVTSTSPVRYHHLHRLTSWKRTSNALVPRIMFVFWTTLRGGNKARHRTCHWRLHGRSGTSILKKDALGVGSMQKKGLQAADRCATKMTVHGVGAIGIQTRSLVSQPAGHLADRVWDRVCGG